MRRSRIAIALAIIGAVFGFVAAVTLTPFGLTGAQSAGIGVVLEGVALVIALAD